MVTQNYQCVHTKTWACSCKSNVDVTILQHILININPCCVLGYKFHVFKLWVQEVWSHKNYQCVQNHEICFTSTTHSSNCDGEDTMLEHVFIHLNLYCIQWYKFRVCRGKSSKDTVTQIYPCASKSWKMVYFTGSQLHIGWGCHHTFTYPHKFQSLQHPTVSGSCP